MKNLKKIIFGCSCILFLSVSNVVFATNGKVTGKTVRIRESADASSNIVTNAYRNDTVNVIETSGDWYKVEYEGKTGYISKEYVEVKENTQSSSENANTQQNPQTNQENNNQNTNDKIKIIKESNLKLLPNFSSKNLGVIQADTEIKIDQEFNNWVQISAGSNNGWVLKNNISGYTNNNANNSKPEEPVKVTIDANTDNKPEEKPNSEQNNTDTQANSTEYQKQKGYINIDTARVRETAGGKIIGNIDINDEVTIIGEEGDWYKITCDEYQAGYVSKSLITIGTISSRSSDEPRKQENEEIEKAVEESVQEQPKQEEQPKAEQQPEPVQEVVPTPEPISNKGQEIVDYAKSFLGSRYVSGGTSPNGFDCSGFTQYVYSHFGYSIARVASGQASNGTEVSRSDLKLGDILIFQDYGRTSIGHVGIYIGDGNFIHAANPSRGVVIDNLNSNSYYNIRFVCARRII